MSKIIRYATAAPTIFIGDRQLDLRAEKSAEERLGQVFPLVSLITDPDGAKMIPVNEVVKLEEKLRQDCEEARQEGLKQGHETGLQEGLNEARKVLSQFESAIQDAVNQRSALLEEAKQQILDLVIQISKKVTYEAMEIDRDATVALIESVINGLVDRSRLKIKVHPNHLPVLEQNMDRFLGSSTAIKDLSFEADPRVRMGGCFIETPTGDIDARLESQFEVVTDALLNDGESN